MTGDTEILRRVEEVLNTGCSPEDVCADAPELLPAVRERLERVRRLDEQFEELFPTPGPLANDGPARRAVNGARLPEIPGYVVDRLLGHGGMGIVYKATHIRLKRPVAIKMMLAGAYASAHDRERFMREAEAIAAIQHPNIVQVHDVGEFDDRLYFSMELVEGETLSQQLEGTPQPARTAAQLMIKLADAMQVAHDRGVVHRDIKPGNVLVANDGTPKITDFGLARRLEADVAMTITGVRMGTPSYMAPEQVTGGHQSIGPAVDIYALGAVLYELLTGRPPFRAETASETERQLLQRNPVAPSRLNARVPRDLETICLKCLHKDPQRRYASAAEISADLARFLRNEPIHARPITRVERAQRWMQRNPKVAALIVVALLLILVAIVAGMREWNRIVAQRAEMSKWADRQAFIIQLQEAGRFIEVRAILDRIPDGGSAMIRAEIEQAKLDLAIVERLDAIRLGRGTFKQGGGFDYAESAGAYATAFREEGLGSLGDDPEAVAARLGALPIRKAIVSALDDWAACALVNERAWILRVAKAIDPDPWRDRVRDQANWANLEHLADLAATADVEQQPVTIMVAMGTRWRRMGGDPTAFLRRVQQLHPSDFWVNFELGLLLGSIDDEAAIGFNRAALAVRPDAAAAHFNLASSFQRLGKHEDAHHHFAGTIAIDPNHTWALRGLAWELMELRHYDDAIAHFDMALALAPADADSIRGRGFALIRSGRGEERRKQWAGQLAGHPDDPLAWDGYAELCLYLGNAEAYEQARRDVLARFRDETIPQVCERAGRACLLMPISGEDLHAATALIDRALAGDPSQYPAWAYPYFQLAKALAEYRAGRFAAAIDLLQGPVLEAIPPMPHLILAMAQHQFGDHAKARSTLDHAVESTDWDVHLAATREVWMCHILRREAEALVGNREVNAKQR